jgi:hypothetical protein
MSLACEPALGAVCAWRDARTLSSAAFAATSRLAREGVHSHKPDWLLARQSQQQGRPGGPQPLSDRGPYSVLAVAYAGQGTRTSPARLRADPLNAVAGVSLFSRAVGPGAGSGGQCCRGELPRYDLSVTAHGSSAGI